MGIRNRSLVALAAATLVLGTTALPSGAHVRAAVGTRTVAASVKAQAGSTATAKAKSSRTPVKVVTKKTTRKKTVTTKKSTRKPFTPIALRKTNNWTRNLSDSLKNVR